MRLVLLALLLLTLGAATLWSETVRLDLEQVDILLPDLPPALAGLRLALIADLHGQSIPADGQLVRLVQAAEVDLIAVAGDLIDRQARELAQVLPFLQALTRLAPVYAVSGNHDYNADWSELSRQLRGIGVVVLNNEHRILQHNGAEYCLAGVADHFSGHADLGRALPDQPSRLTILLSHSPTLLEPGWPRDYLDGESSDWPNRQQLLQGVDLTLSGHTHGGQIKLPLIGAVTRGTGELFPKNHVQGLTAELGGYLYINRGLGTTGLVRARFLARPELTILTLR